MLVNILIGATVLLLPFYNHIVEADYARGFRDNLLSALFVVFGFLLRNNVRKINSYSWAVICILCVFLIFNQHNWLSVNGISRLFYVMCAVGFGVHYYQKHSTSGLSFILYAMALGSIVQSVIGIGNYFGHEWYFEFLMFFSGSEGKVISSGGGPVSVVGSLGNVDLLSSYVSICSLSFLALPRRYLPLMLTPLTALFLSHNIMGICSLSAGVLYYFNNKYSILNKTKVYVLTILSMIALPFLNLGIDNGRFSVWRENLLMADDYHWLIGKGLGWFPDQEILRPDVVFEQEHNEFLAFFNVFGIMGFIILLPWFLKFLRAKDSTIFSTILFAAFCNSYGNFTLHISTTVLPIIVSLCICLGGDDVLQQYSWVGDKARSAYGKWWEFLSKILSFKVKIKPPHYSK